MGRKKQKPQTASDTRADAEDQLRRVLTAARCILWYADVRLRKDGTPLWDFRVSNEEAAERMLPLERRVPDQSYSAIWQTWTLPEDRKQIDRSSLDALVSGKRGYKQEFRVRRADGEIRWLAEDARIQTLEPNHWFVIGVCTDITERKQTEEALRVSEERQRAVSKGLRAVVDIADELISYPDLDTVYRRAVELVRERLGIERCAIFLSRGERIVGTYGTDRKGETTDEHDHDFPATKAWMETIDALRRQEKRMLLSEQAYHEWVDGETKEFGHGWVAAMPIQSATEFIGVFCNDAGITGAPMDKTKQEILAVFCSLLGSIIKRKRTESKHLAMSEGLRNVVDIADELISCQDLDAVYCRAVELAREKLGFERCGLFTCDGLHMRGTYGTDMQGRTTDEHEHEIPQSEEWLAQLRSLRLEDRRMAVVEQPYTEWREGEGAVHFGRGWHAVTPIQTMTDLVGVFCNDGAITGAPMDETKQEVLTVLCSLLGPIIERKITENRHHEISTGLGVVLAVADELIACPDLDSLCRRAVELARDKLGMERCAIFLRDGMRLVGTYGTNRQGVMTDEHDHTIPESRDWLRRLHSLRRQDRRMLVVQQEYIEWMDQHEVTFDGGWVAVTPIQSPTEFVGVLFNDTAITRAPVDATRQEIASVYCSLIGAIIERKRAETELRRLAMTVEQQAEAVIISDTDGTIQYVNPAFEHLSGYARDEVVGRNPRILKSGKQDNAFYGQMWNTLTTGGRWSGHLTNRRKDGSPYEVEATISPIRDDGGRIVNYVSTSRDVTRELQLEEQFRRAQRMEAIGRLAGGIAHDFNNLLTSILGYSQLIQEQLEDGHPAHGDIEEVIHASGRAVNLTKQLLAFTRKQDIETKPLSLNEIVVDMDKLLRRTLGEDIELIALLDHREGYVKGDAGLLEQVIMNLAVNARDAMPKGGTLTIQTKSVELDERYCRRHPDARPGAYVMLAARDTGVGMTEEVREHCFDPFYTSKEMGKGTGLGLAIVYSVVNQFGGFIEIDTSPDAGTRLEIFFPGAERPAAKITADETIELPTGAETILVVEDEDTVRRLTVRILKSLGYKVYDAPHGGDALLLCERLKEPIQLVLTDVVMPHVGGPEMVKRLLEMRSDLKVLYMSGFTDEAFLEGESGEDALPLIAKPFTQNALATKVREILDSDQKLRPPTGY